ncbi:MAG TPA: hypothetical protein VFV07_02020 [Rhizomicrobium sp.]|nr:hypothetical protein [Rhizomicrobium sp.]
MFRSPMLSIAVVAFLGGPAMGAQENVIVQGVQPRAASDACLKIADAKIKQWKQRRIQRDRTDLLADGTARKSEFVFTERALYFEVGGDWRAAQVGWSERTTEGVDAVARRMALSDCSMGATAQEDGGAVTSFTYSQGPKIATTLWISDATGLPVRMEVHQKADKPDQPVTIAFRYVYGDAVQIPKEAAMGLDAHTRRAQAYLTALQLRHAGW